MIRLLPLFLILLAACSTEQERSAAVPPAERDARLDSLERQIEEIAGRIEGTVGVGAVHAETGARVSFHGSEPFSMASVYKLPIALKVMHDVQQGRLRLDSVVTIAPAEFGPYHSPLVEGRDDAPVSASVDSLLALMLGLSDNTASDVLLGLAGGAQAVTQYLHGHGLDGIRVDRLEREMALAASGVGALPDGTPWSRGAFSRLAAEVPETDRAEALARFQQDPRDTATPDAMADLLVALHQGAFELEAAQRLRLLDIMTGSPTGPNRLKGLLPSGTPVAHKTGTGWGSLNDAGLITLPEGRGTVAVAVFIKASSQSDSERERVIAEIARAVYDHFMEPR